MRAASPSIPTLTLAAVIGGLVFERCLGLSVLDPQAIDWIFHWGIDPSVNFMGWHMFRGEPWSLPPGLLHSYGHPVGTSIGITDSLPVMAFPLKLADAYLPPTFQYLGIWYLACFTLLAVFGCLLVATATSHAGLQLLGAAVIALSPTLVHRMGHASLSGHWLIVAALWLHVRCRDHGLSRGRFAAWLLVLWVAAGVTPYIAAMIVALALPTVLGRTLHGVRPALVAGASFAFVTVLGWWAAGYFVLGNADLRNAGFDVLSTNLLAPFDAPAGSLLARVLSIERRSDDQLDGYCYLGLGVFWLTGVCLVRARPHLSGAWTRADLGLALVLVVLGLFAVSSTVTLGTRVLFAYDPGWWGPLTTLRASGRFIWPVYYAFVAGVLALVVTRLPRRAATVVLALAVIFQAADLWGPMGRVRAAHVAPYVDPLPAPFWPRVLPRYAHLVLNPTNMCDLAGFDYRPFALRAGQARVTINAGYAARHDSAALAAYCARLAQDTAARRVREDSIYVVADALVPQMRASDVPVTCVRVDGVAACAATATVAAWDASLDLHRDVLPPDAELEQFRLHLEAEYRDRMRRPLQSFPGTIPARTKAVARAFVLFMNGCSDPEVLDRLAVPARLDGPAPVCRDQALDLRPLPPGDVAVATRARIADAWTRAGVPASDTAVDAVGEAVWLHAYIDLRRQGWSSARATDDVLATIRRVAP